MDIMNAMAIDEARQKEGVWTIVPHSDIKVLLRPIGSPDYQAEVRAVMRAAGIRRTDSMLPQELKDAIAPAIAKRIWIDTQNMTFKGSEAGKTSASREEILKTPKLREFYDFILEQAGSFELFKQQAVEEDAGESTHG